MRTQTRNKWYHVNEDTLIAQINNAEIAERKAREEEMQGKTFSVKSINSQEDATVYRLDAATQPGRDSLAQRVAEGRAYAVEEDKRIAKEIEKWEKQTGQVSDKYN